MLGGARARSPLLAAFILNVSLIPSISLLIVWVLHWIVVSKHMIYFTFWSYRGRWNSFISKPYIKNSQFLTWRLSWSFSTRINWKYQQTYEGYLNFCNFKCINMKGESVGLHHYHMGDFGINFFRNCRVKTHDI